MIRSTLRMLPVIAMSAFALIAVSACSAVQKNPSDHITLQTELGQIIIAVNEERAPQTSNFVFDLVQAGRFDLHSFYRAGSGSSAGGPVELIEGGLLDRFVMSDAPTTIAASGLPILDGLETTDMTGLNHKRGSVSLARDVMDTGVVLPDLVIFLRDAPEYDAGGALSPDGRGYPVFGDVVEGLEILDELAASSRDGSTWVPFLNGQILSEPLIIERADVR